MNNKLFKGIASVLLAAAMIIPVSGGVSAASGSVDSDVSIELPINGSGATVILGKTYKLPAVVSRITGIKYQIIPSNDKVLKRSGNTISVTGEGSFDLVVTFPDGRSIKKTFEVKKPPVEIKLNTASLNMKKGQSTLLKALVKNSTGKLVWSSSNSDVVSVDSNGKVTAKKNGSAVISAKTSSGQKALCTIKVGDGIPVTKVNIDKTSVTLVKGQSVQLHTSVSPSNATDKSVKCSVKDPKIATVSYAKVTGKSVGTTSVTVKSTNGKTAVCKVTVVNPVPVTKVNINTSSVTIAKGQSVQLHTSVSPSNATDKSVKCTVADSKIATVSYGKVTGKAVGTTTVTVKSTNGKTAVCKVTVVNPVPVTKVNINTSSVTLKVGQSVQLHTSVSPSNATDKSVKCTVADPKIATVSYGKVTGKSVGTTTVTVKSTNGKTAVCRVTVTK